MPSGVWVQIPPLAFGGGPELPHLSRFAIRNGPSPHLSRVTLLFTIWVMVTMSTSLHDAFLCNLERHMAATAMTRTELARRMNVSKPYISNMLKGKFVPGLEVITKVAKAIGVPPVSLLVEPAEAAVEKN